MAVLRHFRSRVRKIVHSPTDTTGMGTASMLSSSTSSTSNNSTNVGPQTKQPNGELLGIEGNAKSKVGAQPPVAAARAQTERKQTPRFFFWTLSLGTDKKKEKGSKNSSMDSSPRTPDSSRSVSFEDAESWPFIDDEIEEKLEVLMPSLND